MRQQRVDRKPRQRRDRRSQPDAPRPMARAVTTEDADAVLARIDEALRRRRPQR